jgi:hypothetical protein
MKSLQISASERFVTITQPLRLRLKSAGLAGEPYKGVTEQTLRTQLDFMSYAFTVKQPLVIRVSRALLDAAANGRDW